MTPLTSTQVIDLLTVAASYDNRTASTDEVKAWTAAAAHARWDYQLAVAAIVEHYAMRTERIMPGHITQWIRNQRHDTAMRQPPSLPPARGALNGGWPVGDDPDWGRHNTLELEAIHNEANVVRCRYCQAEVGQRCVNTITGNATKIPHPKRLADANRAAS